MNSRALLFAVGPNGVTLDVPAEFDLVTTETVESAQPVSVTEQQAIVQAALDAPSVVRPLKELAATHRHVAIVAGGLSLPAPYDLALPPLIRTLVDGGIRPARISVLSAPGDAGPVLGRGAIHRYGEEVVGEYEFHTWHGSVDEAYAAADLRIAVTPAVAGKTVADQLPADAPPHLTLGLRLGRKATIDISSAKLCNSVAPAIAPAGTLPDGDVLLCSGGGAAWEATLEEALLSLELARAHPALTAVLAFSGEEGLGSAYFANNLRALLAQAEEILAGGGALTELPEEPRQYDPVLTLAAVLTRRQHLVLLSRDFLENPEGADLLDDLVAWPQVSRRVQLCADPRQLWDWLRQWHGPACRLAANPLGWRAHCAHSA